MNFLAKLKKCDWQLLSGVFFLVGFGLYSLYGNNAAAAEGLFLKQSFWLVIAVFLMFAVRLVDYRVFKNHSSFVLAFYAFSAVLLVLVLIFGAAVRGTRSWFIFSLPFFGKISFQPVEIAKIALILILAKYFSARHIEIYRLRHLVISGFYLLVPFLLVIFQPDFGSAMVLAAIWFFVILFSGVKLRHFFILALIGVIAFAFAWNFFLADYQKARIVGFLNPRINALGESYQASQAKIAVGSGKFFGRGAAESSQTWLGFVPESSTDFIFSAVAERTGFFGASVLLAAFIFVFWRILKAGIAAENNFAKLFVFGYAAFIFVHFIVNIGMNLALLPITGLSLPFVSYGGSGLLALFLGLGILQSFRINK